MTEGTRVRLVKVPGYLADCLAKGQQGTVRGVGVGEVSVRFDHLDRDLIMSIKEVRPI
jgi:hypothetical protein